MFENVRYAVLTAVILSSSTAMADFVVSPDEICVPSDDPCVIDQPYEVSNTAPLDFGLRKVLVTGAGRLSGNVDLACGDFESNVQGRWMEIAGPDAQRQSTIRARRGCSLDSAAPCMHDHECSQDGLGTCSIGDGSIVLSGNVFGAGAGLVLLASGGMELGGDVYLSGETSGDPELADGGGLTAESAQGSIEIRGGVHVDAGPNIGHHPNEAGGVNLRARSSVRVRGLLSAIGGDGSIRIEAGSDVVLEAPIDAHSVLESYFDGAFLFVTADRDIVIQPASGQERLDIDMHGGGYIDGDGSIVGKGGYGTLRAGRDVRVAAGVRINANSGRIRAYLDHHADSGIWLFDAGDDIEFDGRLRSRGRGPTGRSQSVTLAAGDDLSIGLSAFLTLRSREAGLLKLFSRNRGNLAIHGRLNVRGGRRKDEDGERTGHGGTIDVSGGNLSMVGAMETGGGRAGGYLWFDVCRFHLFPGARIDGRYDEQEDIPANLRIYIGESMTADEGSLLAGRPESSIFIAYRDAAKPPILRGITIPEPQLHVTDSLAGCPVCGNREIDEGESCDDGNVEDADGCDENCQVEPKHIAPSTTGAPGGPIPVQRGGLGDRE